MPDRCRWRGPALALAGVLALTQPTRVFAQDAAGADLRRLSLDEALRLAQGASEQVAIARAGLQRARGQQEVARSQFLPQLSGTASYTRTLATEFSSVAGGSNDTASTPAPNCAPFMDNPAWTPQQRTDSLEDAVNRALRCPATGNPFSDFRDLPFGQANRYQIGLSVSQNVFTGGRLTGQYRAASAARRSAEVALTSARAQLILDVAQAYYDAALSERLVAIAESTFVQADVTLRQTRLARQVGNQPEFELLRAQVTRDNQRPVVIRRRADRELAYLRLKQLLHLALDDSLALTTDLGDTTMAPGTRLAALVSAEPDTATATRAPVRQAMQEVQAQQGALAVARAERIPSLVISSQFARVANPTNVSPFGGDFRTNWTITGTLQVPLFSGGQIHGDQVIARANLEEARQRLQQTRQLAALDTRTALAELRAAEASWAASSGTVGQAVQAYQIAEVRYREGISTQTELTDSRLLLQQARANHAVAARDLQLARLRMALIRDLPLGTTGTSPATGAPTTSPIPGTQQGQPQLPRGQPAQPTPGGPIAAASQTGVGP